MKRTLHVLVKGKKREVKNLLEKQFTEKGS